ncbi:hypothetical protein N752_29160 [Desulforamulus aquiferis]|nr:hypothetical protein [Desulforamulus aquiferis]RYD01649.1 hypothetical protein N752_29160 [Desulforamulus aquiferis]
MGEGEGHYLLLLFPREYDISYCRYTDIPEPQAAINKILSWTESKRPVRLIIGNSYNDLVLVSAIQA